MKKKALSLLMALLILAGAVPFSVLSIAAEAVGDAVKSIVVTGPTVSIEPVERHTITNTALDAPARPDASGYAHFIIKVTGEITDDVTVYYTTADLSAIAAAGDYEEKSGSVVLTKEEPAVQISIKTARTKYSISVNVHGGLQNYSYLSRSFAVKLTGVRGEASLSEEHREVTCALLAEHNLGAYDFSGTTVLTPYTWYGRYDILNVLRTEACDGEESDHKKISVSFPTNWATDYVNSGLGANLYMSLQNAHIDESSWNSDSSVIVYIAGVGIKLKGEFHDNEEFGWSPAFLYGVNGVKGVEGNGNKLKDYFTENFQTLFWKTYDGRSVTITANKAEMEDAISKGYVISRIWQYYGQPSASAADPSVYYLALHQEVLGWPALEMQLTSLGGYNRKLNGGDISFRLEDLTAPQLATDADGSYEVYHNFNTATKGEKLRLAIRFSEPVQVNGKTPYLTGKVNGIGTGIEPHPYAIKFNYIGGSGTDTLYFEAEYNGDYQITSITDIQFGYPGSIKDYGGVANSFVPVTDFMIDNFNLDKRQPIISVSNSDAKMGTWGRSKSISVTVSNISEAATLYYTWTDSTAAPESFEHQISLNNVSKNGTQTVTIVGDGNGEKYLHLKAVTRFGREQRNIQIVSATTLMQTYLGPYRFDNDAPTIDETKLLPQSDGSNMFQKKYLIVMPSDASSELVELKMYYVGEDGEDHLIENKTYTLNAKQSDLTVELLLDAAEVGVGDNTRREVTVFFTLTDALGNTDGDVARHKVLFDTHTYIDLEAAGSAAGYVEKTETLDDGFTLIYSDDVKNDTDGDGVYYSFAFKVPAENLQGKTEISVKKNGVALNGGYLITESTAAGVVTIRIDFTAPMAEGYYDVQILSFENSVDPGEDAGAEPVRVSRSYRVYVGGGKGKLDAQTNKGTVLINKVYQLPTMSYFYYMSTDSTVGSVMKEAYNGTVLSASFSSYAKALEYVLFNEYRDLYAVTLTDELAVALNAGNSNAQKALGENMVAREGQVWIRYKSASWDVDKNHVSSDWVFYYYGTTEVLDTSNFSAVLIDAISKVAERVAAKGQTVALTDISVYKGAASASLLDQYGAPYLAPAQIHVEDKRLNNESCASSFSTDITFTADSAIYSSEVVVNGVEYILFGNVVIPTGSRFQYKYIDVNGQESGEWMDIDFIAGQRFSDVLEVSGRYRVRELGSGGVSTFSVYIDKDAPMILVTWKDKDGAGQSQILKESSEKNFRATSLKLVGIDAREYDKYSYVALYRVADLSLYNVYTMSDLQQTSPDIADGNYYIIVSDRSGNSYVLTLYINSSRLNCEIKESENVRIRFTCDRKESQIQEFYVKRNGVLISGKYAPELEFTDSGTYEFYVKDIYGNVYGPVTYAFNRVYPEVVWKYRNDTGLFVTYDPQNKTKYFTLEQVTDGSYTMSTSVNLKFQIASEYGYSFIGIVPDHEENLKDSTVSIKTTQAFQLKVFYKKHPEVYTIYNCIADIVAPTIDVSFQVDIPVLNEVTELREMIEAGTFAAGTKLTPSKISYTSFETKTQYLSNNDTVLSDLIKVNVYDESGLAHVYVYLDGALIQEHDAASISSGIPLSRAGSYRIVAEDVLGNRSEFNFKNDSTENFRYVVDSMPLMLELHDFKKFDENGNFTDSCFGNESVLYVISEQMQIFFMVYDASGEKHFVAFDVSADGLVREMYYCVGENNELVLELSDRVLFDVNDPKLVANKEYVIYEIEEVGFKLYANANNKGGVVLTVYPSDGRELTVEARLNTESNQFYYTKTELSNFTANLRLNTSDGVIEIAETGELIRINRPFSISRTRFEEDKMKYVNVFYSQTNDFGDWGFLFKEEIYGDDVYYQDEGFYYIILVNQYGNESAFIVHISYRFDVASHIEFADGEKIHYSVNYQEPLYSNNKITFELYTNGARVQVKKNGKDFQPVISIENGVTYVILSEEGSYTVTMIDAYGNEIERRAEIKFTTAGFNESLLTGYNENALKRDEGYTNQMLSVDKAVFEAEKICYLAVQYGGMIETIYDGISEYSVALDESMLSNLIGALGDGRYVLIVRDRYGTMLTKVIHYRGTPTLVLERETRSSTETEAYDISTALSIGFWSNSELIFKSEAEQYVFKINGNKTECPKTLAFTSVDQNGRSEYEISYIDEYGFSYSFKAYLVRQALEILPELEVEGQYIDGVLTTTGGVSVIFSDGMYCTYTLNNSEEKIYTPGEKLMKDGTYRFVAVDHAGNMAALTVKKDTTVEFAFVEAGSSTVLQSGGVVNFSKVSFQVLNGDSAYIEKVFRNGVAQSDFSGTRFSEDGKWELIVSDKLGNKAYFCFYIITKQKASFAYTTPYEYRVTELWYDSGDGVKISYLKFVNHSDTSSGFEFAENGKYTVVMIGSVTGNVSKFEFTINNNAPNVSLVGCNEGETTINDVSISGCVAGDKIRIYRATRMGEELVKEMEVTSLSTMLPVINEGGEYRVVVESEAGVEVEFNFARKHVMNTEGSIFVMIVIGVAVVGLFVGLIYRNKSKTDK